MVSLGVQLPMSAALSTSGETLTKFCVGLESIGVDSVWTAEHVILAEHYEPLYPFTADGRMPVAVDAVTMPDPLELLAYIAASTTTLKLGTGMVLGPLHSPAILAKRVSTIDRLSNGRMLLGLSIGWHKEEFEAVGVPFSQRGLRLDDCIAAMRQLWAGGAASYSGKFTSFDRVHSLAADDGHVPIVLGGSSEAALKRAARSADGWLPHAIGPEQFAECASLIRSAASDVGRDSAEIEFSVWPGSYDPAIQQDLTQMQSYVSAGASRILYMPNLSGDEGVEAAIGDVEDFRNQVIEKLD